MAVGGKMTMLVLLNNAAVHMALVIGMPAAAI